MSRAPCSRAPGLLLLGLLLAGVLATLSACGVVGGADPVADSTLPAAAVRTPPGPAYLTRSLALRPRWQATVAGRTTSLDGALEPVWLPDGRLFVPRVEPERRGSTARERAQVLDPASGEVLREVPSTFLGDWAVTPEAITLRTTRRVIVYSPDLSDPRVVEVDASSVESDQIEGPDAPFSTFGPAYTLDGVTWVQWGINSEDDTRTDHGVLRIEAGEPVEVLRNEPVVSLRPSSDGAAMLVLMQDNGADDDCGGCVVEQRVVELDPATGEVAADYGVPDDYDRSWRVEALDKIDEQVVVRFAIGEAETRRDPGVARQTWVYDGDWRHLDELDGTRTTWQDGGRLVWTQLETRRDEGEGAAYRLEWTPDDGPSEVIVDGAGECRRNRGAMAVPVGAALCALVDAPGSLLPPG